MMPVEGVGQGTLNGQIPHTPNGEKIFQGTPDIFMQGQNQRFNLSGQGTHAAQGLDANRIQDDTQVSMTFSNPMMGSQTNQSADSRC